MVARQVSLPQRGPEEAAEGRELYFAYGSNLDESQLRSRCPSSTFAGLATLPGHALAFVGHSHGWDGAVATVIPRAHARVEGVLYEIDAADLLALDGFEGHPRSYTRAQLAVSVTGAEHRRAQVYAQPVGRALGRPSSEYLEVLRLAYLRHGFDSAPLATAANAALTIGVDDGLTLVFVYGSLMLGEENHAVLRSARWVGPASTEPSYTLSDLGEYPAIIEGGRSSVVGELYEVDEPTLRALDELEDHPELYRRVPLMLTRGHGAQGYVLRKRAAGRYPTIASGDWREHRRRIALAEGRAALPVDE